jgi:enoyl-CoA hydratase/carnithine racemase
MTHDYSFIRFSTVGAVGWLEFNRPPVNAFSRQMLDETHDCIEAALAGPLSLRGPHDNRR